MFAAHGITDVAHRLYDLYDNPIVSREELLEGLDYLGAQALWPFHAVGSAAVRSIVYISSVVYSPMVSATGAIASARRADGRTIEMVGETPPPEEMPQDGDV
jgi:hypothetical protein